MPTKKINKLNISVIIFFIIYLGVLLVLAKHTLTWVDELYSLHTTSQDLSFAIKESYYFEAQPPVYFGLLNLWRNFSDSLFFARLPSIIFTILAGLFIYKIFRIFSNKESSVFVMFLFLMNPFIINYSFEVRLYSLIIFFSASSTYFYYKAYLTEYKTNINICLHTAISILGVFTQYLFVFLLVAQAITLLNIKGWRKFRTFFIIHIFVALIFSVNLIFIPTQIAFNKNEALVDLVYVKDFFYTIPSLLFSSTKYLFHSIIKLGIIFSYIIWLLYFIKKKKLSLPAIFQIINPINFLLYITLVVFLSILILFLSFKLNYTSRYMAIIFPSLFVSFLFTLTLYNRKQFILWFAFLSVFYTFIDIKTYSSLVKHFDYERIAEFIENNEESNTPLVFYNGRNSIPFQYYYHGINKIVQLPIPSDYKLRSDQDYLIKDTMTLNTIFQRDLRTAKNFYYLSNKEDEMIETYLVENFLVQLDTLIFDRAKINGLRVRKLIRKK
jgi:hypothetical protein